MSNNLKPSQLLHLAKDKLLTPECILNKSGKGKTRFICFAVNDAANGFPRDSSYFNFTKGKVVQEVSLRIEAELTHPVHTCRNYETYLLDTGIANSSTTLAEFQAHRHALVDKLIAEFKSVGQ